MRIDLAQKILFILDRDYYLKERFIDVKDKPTQDIDRLHWLQIELENRVGEVVGLMDCMDAMEGLRRGTNGIN